ncbi:hypothetical protein JHK85_027320 [Glycine max]|nr:hypothetical protein JHK85_027320 [Glycine max]
MSYHSSDRQSEDEYSSQREMDTSGELRGTKSDYDDHAHYGHSSEGEAGSLSEIEEECFLKQLDENKKGFSEESAVYLDKYVSTRSFSGYNMEPSISVTDGKAGNSCLSTTLTDLASNVDSSSSSIGCTGTKDVEMMDKFADSISPTILTMTNWNGLKVWPPLQISVKCCEIDEFLRNGEIDLA